MWLKRSMYEEKQQKKRFQADKTWDILIMRGEKGEICVES